MSNNSAANIVLQCPQCKKPVHWNDKYPHRPFCSIRCQQLDFGAWATEKNVIAGDPIRPTCEENDDWGDDT